MIFHAFMDQEPIPEIKALRPRAKDSIMLCDAGGLANRVRSCRDPCASQWTRGLESGDATLVSRSDEFIRKLEDEQFLSRMWGVQSDVVGSLANVPAYIAGQPLNMRRRVRLKKPQGPLSLFLETTGSGSTWENSGIRGSAMLALTRILSSQRAVELYVCTTYGETNTMNAVLCKIETTPLDLARACWTLVNLNSMSSIGYTVIKETRADGHPGSWSYGTPDLERRYCGKIFQRFLCPDSEILYVPAAFGRDLGLESGHVWLKNMLKKYGGESVVREDDETVEDTNFREV